MSRHRRPAPVASLPKRLTLGGMAVLLIASTLFAVLFTPAQAAPTITFAKSADDFALVGDEIGYELTASNPVADGAVYQYNLSFRDVLPVGVTYRPGSTEPTTFGDPRIITDPVTGQQTLIWSNVSDLALGQTVALRFAADADPLVLPVGAVAENTGGAYTNEHPRWLPKFGADGQATAGPQSYTASATATDSTTITAVTIDKSEPSPESELVRGVHNHSTEYTLHVVNNGEHPTTSTTVVDHLPANLEFLGCGTVDNSTGVEYPGAPRLDDATPDVVDCLVPVSVTTVEDPDGLPAGVYTRVEWDLGTLGTGEIIDIRYRAAIPMRANEMTDPAFPATANLDNNTGASTRETGTEQSAQNHSRVEGDYQGPDNTGATGTRVGDTDAHTVSVEDLAVQKSVATTSGTFINGEIATYTLELQVSEYVDTTGIVITDVLPDGLCPISSSTNYTDPTDPLCAPLPGSDPTGASFASIVDNGAAGFDITFTAFDIARDGTHTITYQARMRPGYVAGGETSSGDGHTNDVSLTGTSTAIAAQNPPGDAGPLTIGDDSSATIGSGAPTLDKEIGAYADPMDCAAATYGESTTGAGFLTAAERSFSEGDRVCFRIRVDFDAGNSTRDAVLTDFLPDGVVYEAGSLAYDAATTIDPAHIAVEETDDMVRFTLGELLGDGHRYLDKGAVLDLRLSGIVESSSSLSTDVLGNLAKLSWADREGRSTSLRDQVDFLVPPPPPVAIDKQVQEVTPTPTSLNDNEQVLHNAVARFAVTVTNSGTDAAGNGVDIIDPMVWDRLPAPLTCADILPGSHTMTGPGGVVAAVPVCTDEADGSVLRWWTATSLAPFEDDAANTLVLTYDVLMPTSLSQGVTYTNTAGVRTYETETNTGLPDPRVPHFPADNIDPTVPAEDIDVPAAVDTANINLPAATVAKTATTSLTETGNTNGQAVPGETVTYTVTTTVKAGTTIYHGLVSDPVPANLQYQSAAAVGTLPAGFTLTGGATTTLAFPATYTAGATDEVFAFTITARVNPAYTQNNQSRTNTATLTSRVSATSLIPVTPQTGTAAVTIVQPSPTLAKTPSTTTPVAGQTISYTLTATNANNRPILHDTVVVDCVPEGLDVTTLPTIVSVAGDTSGCPSGTGMKLIWPVGDVVSGSPQSITYSVRVSPDAAGAESYVNHASLTGSTLPNGVNDSTVERVLTTPATATVTVPGVAPTKTLAPGDETAVVGDTVTYTVSVPFGNDVNFYDARVLDTLPAGLDVGSLQTISVECDYDDDGTACAAPSVGAIPLTASGQTVGWFLGDLTSQPRDRTVTIVFSATVADVAGNTAGAAITNTARATWNATDKTNPTAVTEPSDRTSEPTNPVTTTVLEPLVAIAKTVSDPTPAPGETFMYTVTVTNTTGPNRAPAHNVDVVDVVPAGVEVNLASLAASGGVFTPSPLPSLSAGFITWTVAGPIAVGGSVPLAYTATLRPSSEIDASALTNTATVDAWESLPSGGRTYPSGTKPSATADVTPQFPYVVVTKATDTASPAYVGQPKSFTVEATNTGTSPAYDVDVSDVLPANWNYVAGSAAVTVNGVSLAAPAPAVSGTPERLVWSDLAPTGLPVGTKIVITYQATPTVDALDTAGVTEPDGTLVPHTNTVSVTAEDPTNATGNKTGPYNGPPATANAHIHSADVSIVKTAVGDPVAGESFSWTLTVANDGPNPAVGPVTVTDTLPPATLLTGATASGSGWSCSPATSTITCTHPGPVAIDGDLPVITVTGTVPADVPEDTDLTNVAVVAASTHDPDPSDNTSTSTEPVGNEADLQIVKTLTGTLVAGQDATYTLDVTNLGPSDSAGPITVQDTLPAGTTLVSWVSADATCVPPIAGVLGCTHAAGLELGDSFQIVVTVAVPADRTAAVVNTATVTGPDDPEPGNNTSTTPPTTPTRTASLTIEKSLAGTDPLIAGATGTYEVTVVNAGPSTATDVVVTDVLPSYLTFVPAGSDAACGATGQTVTCELPELGVGAANAWTFDLAVQVASGHTGEVVNTISVTAPEDPDGDDDVDRNTPGVESDLVITKSHTGEVVAGQNVTYSLTVTNNGPSDEPGPLRVSDQIPAGLTFVSGGGSGSGWGCEVVGGVVECDRTTGLVNGASTSFDLTFAVAANAGPAQFDNIATVDGDNPDPDPTNNFDEDPTTVIDRTNLTIDKSAHVTTAHAGNQVTWSIVVTNHGPSVADSVTVTDVLPAGLSLVSVSGAGWTCPPADPGAFPCSLPSLAPGDSAPLTLVTTVGSGVVAGTVITNTAHVSTTTEETSTSDNDGSDAVTVTTSADLSLTKSVAADQTVVAGEPLTYELVLTNTGPSDATGTITITDALPDGMTFQSSTGPWACVPGAVDPSGQDVVCTLTGSTSIIAGASAPTLTMTVLLAADTAGEDLLNVASGDASNTPDPDGAIDDEEVTPTGVVDLVIVKTHTGEARVGDELTFSIDVRNDGPSEARNVTVGDVLPTGLELVEVTGTDWTCGPTGIDCTLDAPLAPATAAPTLSVTVLVQPAAFPGVENTATVTSDETESDPTNNSSTDPVTVPALVDLSIVKELVGDLQVGDQATYTLTVHNAGPTDDPGPVTVTDDLPEGLTFVSAEGDDWDCVAIDGLVSCVDTDGLLVDETSVITLVVEVGAAAYPSVTNVAEVETPSEDPTLVDHISTVPSTVLGKAVFGIDKDLASLDGRTATWTITVVNEGPTESIAPVTVTDQLPSGLEFVSAAGTGWVCGAVAAVVTCDYAATVPVGTSLTLTVVTTVTAAAGSSITNVATVDGQSGSSAGVTTASDDAIVTLPKTGGPAAWPLALAVVLLLAGVWTVRRARA